jgi:hypothetical protein
MYRDVQVNLACGGSILGECGCQCVITLSFCTRVACKTDSLRVTRYNIWKRGLNDDRWQRSIQHCFSKPKRFVRPQSESKPLSRATKTSWIYSLRRQLNFFLIQQTPYFALQVMRVIADRLRRYMQAAL